MSLFKRSVLPHAVIADLADMLPTHLGDTLVALILHGIHADANRDDEVSPIEVLIVLTDVNPNTIEQLAAVYEQVRGHQSLIPMVLTQDELLSSTDVFPITFMEMKRRHRLLAGVDILAELDVSFEHLRLRCEQELKNLLLRMQNNFLKNFSKPPNLQRAMKRNHVSLSRTLAAALQMRGESCPETEYGVLNSAALLFDLDQDAIAAISNAVKKETPIDADTLRSLYGEFLCLVNQAAAAVDALPEHESMIELVDGEES